MMIMTIWWSKATRLLEFSRSVNRTLRSRAGWDFSVTQQQQDKRILGVRIYIFIPITTPCSTGVTTTNYPWITFIHSKLPYLGWRRVARDWWMEKLNMKKEMLSLYSEFLFNWIIMLAGPRSTYLQIKTFHILIPYCHRLSAGTFLVVPRCCRRQCFQTFNHIETEGQIL